MKSVAADIIARRGGEERRARAFEGPQAKAARTAKPVGKAGAPAEPTDPDQAEALATVMGEGEAELGSFFVPDDKAEDFVKRVSKMLKHAWKYHFMQHGINLPSWVLLLLAHIGMLAAILVPNKERVSNWWNGLWGKLEKKGEHVPKAGDKPNHKPQTENPVIPPAD